MHRYQHLHGCGDIVQGARQKISLLRGCQCGFLKQVVAAIYHAVSLVTRCLPLLPRESFGVVLEKCTSCRFRISYLQAWQ